MFLLIFELFPARRKLNSPVWRACCSFSRFSSCTMSLICFCSSTTAASLDVSGTNPQLQLFDYKTIINFKPHIVLHLPFFVGFLGEICWDEVRLTSRIPTSTKSPLSSMLRKVLNEAAPTWTLPIYGLLHTLPFTSVIKEKH